ncbi:GNAT family N-acetyltransferase [Vallitalea okinawensis]|uniref:GNAT family N-acetyltransferase n=1 Tax=Vallitalea okinawensis TaxID=2078660 RepID=UPI000CFD9B28|nr:GNAT family N-acetyltransferase [Vallitalea okinawensis]
MSNKISVTIERINKDNYHKFDDMISWRINGVERSAEGRQISENADFTEVLDELCHPDFYVYAAEYQGRFIGWISLIYMPKIGKWKKGVIYVDELWTTPEFRQMGVAYRLMQKAFELQTETGAVKVRLYTNNPAARMLYEKCGLEVKETAVFME